MLGQCRFYRACCEGHNNKANIRATNLFSSAADTAAATVKIQKMKQENPTIEICPGITRRTIANGKTMYQMIATLAAGSRMPEHQHTQEQIVHILEGQMRLIVDGVPHELSTGDSFYLASNVPHGVETILPTRVLDTFSPPRDDYLAIDEKASEDGAR